jgi:hypothetical protein
MALHKNEWQALVTISDGIFFKYQQLAAYKGVVLCVVNPLRHSGHRLCLPL